jgi:signal transduction histidine kinase
MSFLNRLQWKVTLAFLAVSLVPLGVVSFFSLRTANGVIESIVTSQLENVASDKQQLLERWIAERRADLGVVAGSSIMASLDASRIGPYLDLVRRQYEVYRRFVVTDRIGQVIYDSADVQGTGIQVGENRKRVGKQGGETVPLPAASERALPGDSIISQASMADDNREAVFHLAAPIRGRDGSPAGAVAATVGMAAIRRQVLKVSLGKTGECYLVDHAGKFLVHNDPQRIFRDTIARSESFNHVFAGGRPRTIYTDYRGIAVLGASRPISGTEWHVVVEQDRDEAFAPADRLRANLLATLALTSALAIGLSALLGFYVTAPVRALSGTAHELARGEFEKAMDRTRTTRRDEIGALYRAFAHMAGQLHQQHVSLERRVDATEEELHKTGVKLQDTLAAAARSEHLAALGRLASGVAHEIRTPLASLKLYLQQARDELIPSPEHYEDFEIAMRQVERIAATVNEFLAFARPREPVFARIDFAGLVEDALAVIRPRANQENIEIACRVASDLPIVEGDAGQLGDVLINLLVNALDAMPQGGQLAIRVERAPDSLAQPWVRIEVADTGVGIAAEDLDKLFEPFYTTKASGSGLGLAIAQGTVQRHGGAIQVRSKPGEGATFSVLLPGKAA